MPKHVKKYSKWGAAVKYEKHESEATDVIREQHYYSKTIATVQG